MTLPASKSKNDPSFDVVQVFPQSFSALLRIVFIFLELGVKPAPLIHAGSAYKFGPNLPVIARLKLFNLLFTLNYDR